MKERTQFQHYLQRRAYSPHTVESYLLDLHLFFKIVGKQPPEVDRKDVEAFIDQQRDQQLHSTTINRRLHALKHFFEFLIDIDEQGQPQPRENPVRRSHFLRRPRPLPRAFREQELDKLFAVITDLRDRTIFTLMLRAGLRVSEVAKLEVEDVDLQEESGTGTVFVREGKGKRDRLVYLSEDVVKLLEACLKQRASMGMKTAQLFWNHKRKGEGISREGIQKAMERYCKQAGIQGSCQRLRHTFATTLLENGTQLMTIRDFLGHSSVLTSERYAKLSDERVRTEYYQAMEKVMSRMALTGTGPASKHEDGGNGTMETRKSHRQ